MFAQQQLDHHFSFFWQSYMGTKVWEIVTTLSYIRAHTVDNLTTILTQNLHTILRREHNKQSFYNSLKPSFQEHHAGHHFGQFYHLHWAPHAVPSHHMKKGQRC